MDKIIFSQRIKNLRKERRLTQTDLGKMINVTKVSVCGYESGNRTPNIETLEDLANVFGVSLDYLMGNDRFAVAEKNYIYNAHFSKEVLEFISYIKKEEKIYKRLINDPKRFSELLIKRLS